MFQMHSSSFQFAVLEKRFIVESFLISMIRCIFSVVASLFICSLIEFVLNKFN